MSESANKKQRIYYWDNMKGILIFLVVLGHALYSFQNFSKINAIVDILYMFHMPAFVFISGYFSVSKNSRSYKSLAPLFFAFLIFNTVHMMYAGTWHILSPYYSCWYLIALIFWRLITPHLAKIKGILPMLLVISLIAGFWKDIDNTLAMARIITFYFYFMAGYLYRDGYFSKIADKYKSLDNKKKGILITAFSVSSLALLLLGYKFLSFKTADLLMQHYIRNTRIMQRGYIFVTAIIVIITILLITPKKEIPILSTIGRNSLTIFLFHRIITLICAKYLGAYLSSTLIALLYGLLLSVAITLLFGLDPIAKYIKLALNKGADLTLCIGDGAKYTVAKLIFIIIAILVTLYMLLL
jgi:fucose 4-O-acetylase-like acetyltransferase